MAQQKQHFVVSYTAVAVVVVEVAYEWTLEGILFECSSMYKKGSKKKIIDKLLMMQRRLIGFDMEEFIGYIENMKNSLWFNVQSSCQLKVLISRKKERKMGVF